MPTKWPFSLAEEYGQWVHRACSRVHKNGIRPDSCLSSVVVFTYMIRVTRVFISDSKHEIWFLSGFSFQLRCLQHLKSRSRLPYCKTR